jgi:hypothetical protein
VSKPSKASTNKAVQKVVNDAVKRGWTVEYPSGHAKIRSPCGRWAIPVARTPRDDNSARQLQRDIAKVENNK